MHLVTVRNIKLLTSLTSNNGISFQHLTIFFLQHNKSFIFLTLQITNTTFDYWFMIQFVKSSYEWSRRNEEEVYLECSSV